MDRLASFLERMPRPLLMALGAAVVCLVGWLLYRISFPQTETTAAGVAPDTSVVIDFPQAGEPDRQDSRLEGLESGRTSVSDYWDRLENGNSEDNRDSKYRQDGEYSTYGDDWSDGIRSRSPSPGGGSGTETAPSDAAYLDPNEYSLLEIDGIRRGYLSKAGVDAQHARDRAADEDQRQREAARNRAVEAEKRRRLEAVNAYAASAAAATASGSTSGNDNGTAAATASESAAVPPQEQPTTEEPRRTVTATPVMTLTGDGIITSLDASPDLETGTSQTAAPCRVTFLKDEKIVSGQRVILRLMQDLTLSGGEVIPSNTHVAGICTIGDRLLIRITAVSHANRIYYTVIDAYDSDGSEGIYCPVIVDSRAQKAGKNIGREIGNVAAEVLGGVASTANSYLGSVTRRGVSEITSSVDAQGNVSVSVSSGYEFLICEKTEEKRK